MNFNINFNNFIHLRHAQTQSALLLPKSPTTVIGSTSRLYHTVNELLTSEMSYINALEHGINNYMALMEDKLLSPVLMEQKLKIFSVIQPIYEFHKYQLYPALESCNLDVKKIADTFSYYVNNNSFYNYILYTANKPHSDYFYDKHKEFFYLNEKIIGDRLGVATFLIRPIQRLPKYVLIFGAIYDEIQKRCSFGEQDREYIRSVCLAEKNIQSVIDTANDALILSEIDNASGNYCVSYNLILKQNVSLK